MNKSKDKFVDDLRKAITKAYPPDFQKEFIDALFGYEKSAKAQTTEKAKRIKKSKRKQKL